MNDFQKSSQFSTYVVASGLQYGMGEHMFHLFFKVNQWIDINLLIC